MLNKLAKGTGVPTTSGYAAGPSSKTGAYPYKGKNILADDPSVRGS
jgi:hypothetical protein